jgi:hypothetical protein
VPKRDITKEATEIRTEWGKQLRRYRKIADVDGQTVAEDVNPVDGSKSWTSQVESGQIDPPLTKVVMFAKAVGVRLALTAEDPWTALDAAISAVPKGHEKLQRQLRLLIADELEGEDTKPAARPKKVGAGSSR